MTDERARPRYLNEPFEAKRSDHDYGSDRSQGRDHYERLDAERSSSPRYEDEQEYTYGDNVGRERSSGASYGPQGQGPRRTSHFTGHQGQYSSQGFYRASGPEDRDQDRGGYRSSSQPFSSEGDRGSPFSGPRTHGPYTGKGPKGYKRSDEQMCEEANQALERNGRVDASEIEVTCDSGVLKLTGKVEDRAAKRDAEDCVVSIYGVRDVMNELKVDNGFFANLFGTGSNSDNGDQKKASKSSNKSSQKLV